MKKFFSASNLGFYIEGINETLPEDAVSIPDAVYREFSNVAWPEYKVIGSNESGMPVWLDAPPLTKVEAIAAADSRKQVMIDQSNSYMNSKQWPGKAAIGRLKGDELTYYCLWLDYLDALEDVNTSLAPDIIWPQQPSV